MGLKESSECLQCEVWTFENFGKDGDFRLTIIFTRGEGKTQRKVYEGEGGTEGCWLRQFFSVMTEVFGFKGKRHGVWEY